MKKLVLIAVSTVLLGANSAFALQLTLENKTGKELHELYFAPAGDEEWGPDQLGDKTVANNDKFTLTEIPVGKYDVLFVDEKGAKCDIRDVEFKASEVFEMTKQIIKGCQAATSADEKEDEES